MSSSWDTCGLDTVHVTYKEGPARSPAELAALLEEFQRMYELPTAAVTRDRGVSGFASAAVDSAAGLRLDWTRPGEEGQNPGYFCLQVKGAWFSQADGEATADFLQLLEAYGPLRVTRLDFQQTWRTEDHLTPWWIDQFDRGLLRVVGKRHYEPRGRKSGANDYPMGATLYHGSRNSERYARQYDKHLQDGAGPPRRRDEIECKGETARNLWTDLHSALNSAESEGFQRGAALTAHSRRVIRALLPIRDTSRWADQELPKRWSEMAKEPLVWSTLFDDQPATIKPAQKRVSSLLKSYRYATQNFGAAVAVTALQRWQEYEGDGMSPHDAVRDAYASVIDDFVNEANESRAMEFISEMAPAEAKRLMKLWLDMVRTSASNQERERDQRLGEA